MNFQISVIPAFETNYIFLVHEPKSKKTMVVDPGDAKVVLKELRKKSLTLDYIWITHHHPDHVGGNLELKKETGCRIIGPTKEKDKIPGIDQLVTKNDQLKFGEATANILETPGHTLGSLCYWFKDQKVIFVGDTLFAAGCGRLFEGSPQQMFESLQKFHELPKDTYVYCAHEYSLQNCRFALSITPNNSMLKKRYEKINLQRKKNQATIPFELKEDLETNPFLGVDREDIQNSINFKKNLSSREVFAKLRSMKDCF